MADLCLRLQISGYMLRNAEYVMALQKLLSLRSTGRKQADLRAAFSKMDRDDSGYIEASEVEALFASVDEGHLETSNFLRFFDANGDGRISFAEFAKALGGADDSDVKEHVMKELPSGDDTAPQLPEPSVEGEIEVTLPSGVRTVDAALYIEELRAEAARLRTALVSSNTGPSDLASISEYIGSLSSDQRDLLTSSMSDDAKEAADELVKYVLSGGVAASTGAATGGQQLQAESEVNLEKRVLEQICRWQLILGYRLRELEARDDANKRLGA